MNNVARTAFPVTLCAMLVLLPTVAGSRAHARSSSDWDYRESRRVVASVYNWYCAREVGPTPDDLGPIRHLLTDDLFTDLCRGDSYSSSSATNPFTRGAKACSFRLGYSFVDGDVAVVNISLTSEGHRLRVVAQLSFQPSGWVISEIRHWHAGRMVRRPELTPSAPPN
jgi:hypothetical protein